MIDARRIPDPVGELLLMVALLATLVALGVTVARGSLDPLGMTNTRFEYTEAMIAHEGVGAHPLADFLTTFMPFMTAPWPSGYVREYDSGYVWFNRFLFDGNPPSGLIGPAPEMATLGAAILNGGELDGVPILLFSVPLGPCSQVFLG